LLSRKKSGAVNVFPTFRDHAPRDAVGSSRRTAGIGSATAAHNAAAAIPTGGVIPAAADQVSALAGAPLAAHAGRYQAVAAQAAAIHQMFVNTLSASAASYTVTEAANAAAAG
jgi:hypothetical protein